MAFSRLSSLALLLVVSAAFAQAPARVRGMISAFDGNTVTVDGARVVVAEKTEIVFAQPMGLAEIRPGDFLAITSMKGPDGTLTAYEVRRFPKPVSPGHRLSMGATTRR